MTMENAVAVVPQDDEIAAIRKGGIAMIVHRREVAALEKIVAGMEWGSGASLVRGSQFSPQTRYMIAEFARITGANLLTQIDIFNGKPYHNAAYWKDRCANDELFIDFEQEDISPVTERALREIGQTELADTVAIARLKWHPPAWATHIYVTRIRRWMNAAPLEAIKAGRIPFAEAQNWIAVVEECNYAGGKSAGKPDPVGNTDPDKTARTRSFRRCAVSAFSAWAKELDEQISKVESAIEAEWEYVKDELAPTGHALTTGTGEPTAAPEAKALPLPVHGEPEQEQQAPEPEPAEPEQPAWDRTDAHKRLFATLKDCGIADKDRKKWAKTNNLPESTKDWTEGQYKHAQEILVGPIRDEVRKLAAEQGVNIADLSLSVIGRETPDYARHWVALLTALRGAGAEADL
jgi:hypothetical protein